MALLSGVAAYLAGNVQVLEWSPGGTAYAPGTYGLYLLELPAAALGVSLAPYGGLASSPRLGHDSPNVQARVRGGSDPRDSLDLAQGVYDALHGLTETQLSEGTYVIAAVCLQSGPVYLGKNANGQHEFTVNTRFAVRHATVHRESPV